MITKDKVSETQVNYKKTAEKLLWQLGGNRSYKGFDLTTCSIEEVIRDPGSLTCICKGLYVDVAKRFNTSIYCIERNIRTMKQLIWKYGDRSLLEEIFGPGLSSKSPCNSIFLDKLARYVAEHAQGL